MIESFGAFTKKKQTQRMPYKKAPEDVYDEHMDQIIHHLREVRKLTHPDSLIHKALGKMGVDSTPIHELHVDVLKHLGK